MENPEEAVVDPGLPLHLAFLCSHCNNISDSSEECEHCGNLLSNFKDGEKLVSDVVEVEVVGIHLNDVDHDVEKDTNVVKVNHKVKKREVNCYGMYLKEQKELNKNISHKLDSEAMIKKWKDMNENQREVYKNQSIEDKRLIQNMKTKSKVIKLKVNGRRGKERVKKEEGC